MAEAPCPIPARTSQATGIGTCWAKNSFRRRTQESGSSEILQSKLQDFDAAHTSLAPYQRESATNTRWTIRKIEPMKI